jgi:hypothetical protein
MHNLLSKTIQKRKGKKKKKEMKDLGKNRKKKMWEGKKRLKTHPARNKNVLTMFDGIRTSPFLWPRGPRTNISFIQREEILYLEGFARVFIPDGRPISRSGLSGFDRIIRSTLIFLINQNDIVLVKKINNQQVETEFLTGFC